MTYMYWMSYDIFLNGRFNGKGDFTGTFTIWHPDQWIEVTRNARNEAVNRLSNGQSIAITNFSCVSWLGSPDAADSSTTKKEENATNHE